MDESRNQSTIGYDGIIVAEVEKGGHLNEDGRWRSVMAIVGGHAR